LIRQLAGFETFLLGPQQTELLAVAEQGPIILFNVAIRRSDALLVTRDGFKLLPLPNLKYHELESKARAMKEALDSLSLSKYPKASVQMSRILEWLWVVAAGPVLEFLGYTEQPQEGSNWPRVWWINSSFMNILPIHAAGYHHEGSGNTVLDRVISSYAPSIRSLIYARQKISNVGSGEQKAVVVAMPKTTNSADLPFVEKEVATLQTLLTTKVATVTLQNPKRIDVLSELRDCQIAHFACHGNSLSDPSQSHLMQEDYPLTVADLTSLRLEEGQLAYLSACYSADNRAVNLLDEGIHLVGACQLSGFPYVIGPLWRINDSHSAILAKRVYQHMLDVSGRIDVRKSSEALHLAVLKLRSEIRSVAGFSRAASVDPIVWAAFVHVGA
jgi:hypothetical protein